MPSVVRIAISTMVLVAAAGVIVLSQRSTDDYPEACVLPLKNFCNGECRTYERQLEMWEADWSSQVRRGTCGEWRTLSLDNGLSSHTLYFDRAGQLVGVATASDAIDPVCKGERIYGRVPKCVVKPAPAPEGVCMRPIPETCVATCASFEKQLAVNKVEAPKSCSPADVYGKYFGDHYTVGTCGEYRYLKIEGMLVDLMSYYDRTGRLIAMRAGGSVKARAFTGRPPADPECPVRWSYGPLISCEEKQTADLCPRK